MVAPLVALGAGTAAAGLAGSIFGQKKLGAPDISGLLNTINTGAQSERDYTGQLVPGINKNLGAFQTGITGAEAKATGAQTQAGQEYLANLDPITSRILQNQQAQLKQSIFGQIPEASNAAREALAASGGLSRGVSAESLAKIPIQAASQFATGATGLETQSLAAKQQAVGQLFTEESAQIAEQLGIDRDTYNTILNSGDNALMAQISQLIDTQRNQTTQTLGAQQFGLSGQYAANAQDAANRNAIFSSLTGLGGTLAGYGLGGAPGVTAVDPTVRRQQVLSALGNNAVAGAKA